MTLNKTDRIVITLGTQIVGGKYVPGSPLPAEAELCEEFETSRNIIREVFRSLMAKRLIEMKALSRRVCGAAKPVELPRYRCAAVGTGKRLRPTSYQRDE